MTKRAWDRIAHLAIRVYPVVPNRDYYFVNIMEARPKLALTDHGTNSFFRAMRRAGLMKPVRPSDVVAAKWQAYLNELCAVLGIANVVPASPPPAASLPLPSSPLSPVSSSDDGGGSSSLATEPLPAFFYGTLTDDAPEVVDLSFGAAPASLPAAATPSVFSAPQPTEPNIVAAESASSSSGGRDEWSELSDLLCNASGEELDNICRELVNTFDASDVFI